jgi:hypothetical protein
VEIRLNLATAPLENKRGFVFGAAIVGVAAVGLFALLAQQSYRDLRESRDIRQKTSVLEAQMRQLREDHRRLDRVFKEPENKRTMDRAAFLNSLIAQRSFPWTQIFMDFERLLPEGVRVVNITPQVKDGRVEVKLVIGATSDEAKLKFLKALEGAKQFNSVQVLSETRPNRPGQEDRVRLELVAWYSVI